MAKQRAIGNQLIRWLAGLDQPIYALDQQRAIVYCNPACGRWVGLEPDALLGRRAYHAADASDHAQRLACRLCPPPEALAGQTVAAILTLDGEAGATSRRHATFVPLVGDSTEILGVVAIVQGKESPDDAASVPGGALDLGFGGEAAALHRRLQILTRELRCRFHPRRLVGESPAMQRVRQQVRLAARSSDPVQVVGPRGSGREHVARTIHAGLESSAAGPLMPLSCAGLEAELLQTTVLAFLRRCQLAPDPPASLLLLEIDQLFPQAQAEMLAFLRLPTPLPRAIVTTSRHLTRLAEQGDFDRELAFRLSTLVIEIPPLRERREDIPLLCQQFVEDFNATSPKQLAGFSSEALDQLAALPWRGDVDELAAVVLELCEQAEGPLIRDAELSRRVRQLDAAAKYPPPQTERIELDVFLADVERELLQRALRTAGGNKAEAARLLGISRQRLLRRVAQLGVDGSV